MAPLLHIVGAGKVGRVLGRLFAQSGAFRIGGVLNRSAASARAAAAFIGAGEAVDDVAALGRADAILLAVSDSAIAACAAGLAAHGLLDAGVVLFHCSGALAGDVLAGAHGAACASVHPVRTFADPERVAREFAGTVCSLEGDAPALALLRPALAAIGARTVEIDAARKLVYHAGSVFACNYLATLADAALRAYAAAGVPAALASALADGLMRETLDNIARLGPAAALTGPVARGDFALVARQADAVARWDAAAGALYQALVAPTAALAARKWEGEASAAAGETQGAA